MRAHRGASLTLLLAASLAPFLAGGCATMVNGPMQRVRVDSRPAGATVTLTRCGPASTRSAVTPSTVVVARRATQCRLHLSLPGHEDAEMQLTRRLARDRNGRLVSLGTWCGGCEPLQYAVMSWLYMPLLAPLIAIDFAAGSLYEVSPANVDLQLRLPEAGGPGALSP